MTAIWNAAAGTPTATHRVPVDTGAAGSPTRYTVQQLADLETSIGVSVNALGSIGTNTNVDLSLGGYVSATITGNLTLSFTNPPAGGTEFTLVLTNGGAFTVTWPGTVTWAGATAPTLTASGVDVLHFASGNGGTNWYGWLERDETAAAALLSATTTVSVSSATAPSSGQVLTATSSTAASWQTPSGGGTPGGSDTQVQFNDGGAFGGDAGLVFNKTNKTVDLGGGTLTASDPVLDLSQTWNNAAVTFTGVRVNVTDTASASGSRLFSIQSGGSNRFSVLERTGASSEYRISLFAGGITFVKYGDTYVSGNESSSYRQWLFAPGNGLALSSVDFLGWSNQQFNAQAGTYDVRLYRDGADTLAQRRTTNAQTFRVYATYTDSSNYVRASLAATSTAVTLAAETAGTGADNVPVILTPAGTSQVEVGNGVQFTEITAPSAPAANKVILFAQDNGAGKTQLMALFASGAAQQVAIEP